MRCRSVDPPGVSGGLQVDGNTNCWAGARRLYVLDLGMVPYKPVVGSELDTSHTTQTHPHTDATRTDN